MHTNVDEDYNQTLGIFGFQHDSSNLIFRSTVRTQNTTKRFRTTSNSKAY